MSRSRGQQPIPHRYRRKSRRQGWRERKFTKPLRKLLHQPEEDA